MSERALGAQRVATTLAAMRNLQRLLSTVKDAETGQRGYLLTGEPTYLEPYESAIRALGPELIETKRSIVDDPTQLRRLELASELANAKVSELERTVETRRAGHAEAALAMVRSNHGKELMDDLRRVVGEMLAGEQSRLDRYNDEWARATAFSLWVTWGGSTLLFVLIVAAASMSSRDFQQQAIQAWLRTGQGELGARLQGEQTRTSLGDRIASFLAHYLDAPLVA
ncbi:MAG TPA: CHASE3 domain-containing protein, partial [Polyangiaceae bacterium]|nr:CHASE3 domain-containing protein [Polyangiaceae bacterium]